MSKYCNGCKLDLPESDFQERKKAGKTVLRSRCRPCTQAEGRQRWKDVGSLNPPPFWRRHHMTDDQYWAMFNAQNGACAIQTCGGKAEVIDHDHKCCPGKRSCGKCIRALLCNKCNTAEGLLGGSPSRIIGLAQYMLRFEKV